MRRFPLRLWLLVILSALLQTLPFPLSGPLPVWRAAFSWIALTPLLWSLSWEDSLKMPVTLLQGAKLGYLCGILWYLGNCYWIYQTMYRYGGLDKPVAVGILLLFCLYLGLYHALFSALFVALRRSRAGVRGALLLTPFFWVAVELARARITGFPWDLLGITQVDNPLLLHLAPYTGAYGLSFAVAAVNALWLLRLRIRERRWTRPLLITGGLGVLLVYAGLDRSLRLPPLLATTATATLLQENLGVGTEAAANFETQAQKIESFSRLSLFPSPERCVGIPEAASTRCGILFRQPLRGQGGFTPSTIIAWPEAPSEFFSEEEVFNQRMAGLARQTSTPLVIGSIGVDAGMKHGAAIRVFDSAALFKPDGTYAGRYDKIHLVPWGEYIPFERLFFFAKKLTAGVGSMTPGTERTVFRTGGHRYGVFICYESIFGDEVRRFVKNGAEVLVNISDDGWYGDTSAAWQHLNMVRMRAIENHRWILRSTNTGVTAIIDPYGRVTAAVPRHIRTALRAGFNFEQDVTFYTQHGDLFAYLCVLVTVLTTAMPLLPVRQDGLSTARGEDMDGTEAG